MRSIHFGGSYTVDSTVKQFRGEKEAQLAETLLAQNFGPLADETVDVTYRSKKNPTDFEAYSRDTLYASTGQKNYAFDRLHANPFTAAFFGTVAAGLGTIGLVWKGVREARDVAWQSTVFRTEPLEKFIPRVLKELKAQMDADKKAPADKV